MSGSFAGKTVVITGASRGIGLGVAASFAAEGADIHLIADDDGVVAAAGTIGASAHQADITDAPAVETALSSISRIDILINNAGYERMTPLISESDRVEETFKRVIEVNIIGTSNVTRRAIPKMRPGSAIVNTASIWGRVAEAQFDAYVASKHAIIGMTKTWAKELGPLGIRVNAVCPGWVRTEASIRSLGLMAAARGMDEESLLRDVVAGQALSGLMEPEDMGETYLFLASDRAANITGQSLGVDRGEVPW
ncbi:SDR family NAD(P)-dependent oxidoreductase [Rhizobium wuzhouense]|uniref:3-beta hydroxysteroid dehydrogenase n=1 Tax=Rhizobium wuzhouense TaxID=1986026 RepID=A0ABX5NUK0_9HYPH|nr:SDR family oxidoreductase [Rhizobium wuzhouense]PYB72389.1 3-beta hydroxysteroid dehydrogenase [Rhizobium wuzhouense]